MADDDLTAKLQADPDALAALNPVARDALLSGQWAKYDLRPDPWQWSEVPDNPPDAFTGTHVRLGDHR